MSGQRLYVCGCHVKNSFGCLYSDGLVFLCVIPKEDCAQITAPIDRDSLHKSEKKTKSS